MSDVLEDRLRRTFDAVAATSDESVIDATEPPRSRRPIALVAASLLVVLGLAATMFAVRSDDDPAPAAELPAWYQAIAPALPGGYTHVAVIESGDEHVMFQIVDPASPAVLIARVSRVPVSPDPSGTMTLSALEAGSSLDESVRLPDGREVSISCALVTLEPDDMSTSCTESARPVTDDELRTLALRLAVDLPIDALPPSDAGSEAGSDDFPLGPAVLTVVSVAENGGFARPQWGFMEYSIEPDASSVLQVRYVHGLEPPIDTPHLRQDIGGATLTWRISQGSLVTVISRPPLPTTTGDDILTAIDTVAPSTAPTWDELLLPALPEGFGHIAIVESDERHVTMEALDLSTGHVIRMRADRQRPRPDDETPPADAVVVTSSDGRTVSVTCATLAPEPGCPKIAGRIPRIDELRTIADALASLPVDALPAVDGIPVGIDMLAIAGRATAGLDMPQISGGSQQRWFSSLTFGTNAGDRPDLVIRAVHSVRPAPDVTIRSVGLDDRTMTWRGMPDGSVWVVSATSAVDAAIPAAILEGVLDQLTAGPLPQLPEVPTTVPPG